MNDVANEVLDHMDIAFAGADDALAELEAKRVALDDKISRLKKFIQIMAPHEPSAPRRRGKDRKGVKGTVKRINIDPKRLELITRTILAVDKEQFTMHAIHAILQPSWSSAATAQTFRYLRSIEFIGKMGISADRKQLWKVVNAEVGEGVLDA
jgi:hypothetical protein